MTLFAQRGVIAPAACVLGSGGLLARRGEAAAPQANEQPAPVPSGKGLRPASGREELPVIVRDFQQPRLELIRLLREACEVEHALMLQYLYAAFSLKSEYEDLAGYGDANAEDLLGVAIQEMQHLATVNRMLVALGSAPNLTRQDFPYEPDIYPFAFNLEPLTRHSLAKYSFAEAPAAAMRRTPQSTPDELDFLDALNAELAANPRPNHIGSLYSAVLACAEELQHSKASGETWDLWPWMAELKAIQVEGEIDHFAFFKSLFSMTHQAFQGKGAVWSLSPEDPAYPSRNLPANPSAFVGHPNQIEDPETLAVAWLGNLHYWAVLSLLDYAFRRDDPIAMELAQAHMMGPLWALLRHLPSKGTGMPFDPLSIGYAAGLDARGSLAIAQQILQEATLVEGYIKAQLPSGYPLETAKKSIERLTQRAS